MKVVIQRVLTASVSVDGTTTGMIGPGYLLLVGLAAGDDVATVRRLATDVSNARLMPDALGKMGISLRDAGGQALAVSQFTLLADFSKGNRPSFNGAAKPESAKLLFDLFVQELSILLDQPVPTGVFGADMRVELVNDGPVTVVLE
ncbi:MAG: D-tyrosyl-tRNA(Tyr) deacylase [Opitutia bacterium AMD-G1]|nr:MAG: D-tyrosyl-tRNA(Tyr) deacylase [Opitutae bacterium AMD-G1]